MRKETTMTKLRLMAALLIAAFVTAGAPNSASAYYHHVKMVAAPGKHFGAAGGPWPIFICTGGVIFSALAANATQNRELTAPEAWSCGLLYWFNQVH
jgi:hypothetical protein